MTLTNNKTLSRQTSEGITSLFFQGQKIGTYWREIINKESVFVAETMDNYRSNHDQWIETENHLLESRFFC